MPGHESQRPVSLRRHYTTNQSDQAVSERACNANLQHSAFRERHQLTASAHAIRPASHYLGVHRNTVQSIPDFVTAAPSYLSNDFQCTRL
jgi:hypothetical protein